MTQDPRPTLRLDKWLWQARFFKTRTLAAKQVTAGHVRVNGDRVSKAATSVGVDDVLTFAQGDDIRVIEIVVLGERRGPAPEAQTLFLDRSEPKKAKSEKTVPNPLRFEGKGRPTKKDRRRLDLSRRSPLD